MKRRQKLEREQAKLKKLQEDQAKIKAEKASMRAWAVKQLVSRK